MEHKTKVHAEEGAQDLIITRDFDLPVELVFLAYTEADLVAQWMNTKVVKLDSKRHGSYQFETATPQGNTLKFNGVIHNIVPNASITRTFEMEGAPIGVQLEYLEFEKVTDATSRLRIHIVYKSNGHRAIQLQMPFAMGLNMAHNRLEEIAKNYPH